MVLVGCLKSATLAALLIVAGGMLEAAPVQAQGYPAVNCNDPYYYQYCQQYYAWYQQYYNWYAQQYAPYSYDYLDPYYAYGVPVGVGLGFGFFHPPHSANSSAQASGRR